MPGPPVFIDQDPGKTEPASGRGKQREDEAEEGLSPADGVSVEGQEFDFPCPHAQGLAAVSPKPRVKHKADRQQINRIKILSRCKSFSVVKRQDG